MTRSPAEKRQPKRSTVAGGFGFKTRWSSWFRLRAPSTPRCIGHSTWTSRSGSSPKRRGMRLVDYDAKRNGLSKADLHIFSKLFDDGLERGQEAEAFSWRQIGGHDDVLEFLVGHLINVEMTRQPAP